ncbi:Rrf2 family transcriptional regulator [Agrobacterium sp. AGB01]|uniref:RrF2 family transcriptional regulator n=1 Tax=Agrobacterium sp. AGB01 TaxID=2769302 RepID=UPI00177F5E36|nr:Rrf2 family transcriptional regulator [Agrobacterium sp. AGB01]MBD9388526.1 Rrf2 family transcriptional regulator [Agrobacterium sp. AGB01]
MRLTRRSEVAIGILTACARSPMHRIRTLQAAKAAGTTKLHAAQVVNLLVHEGFLLTGRGRSSGIELAVPPQEILLGDVLRRVQPDVAKYSEIDIADQQDAQRTSFSTIMEEAEANFLEFMDRFSILDLVSDQTATQINLVGVTSFDHAVPTRGADNCPAVSRQ